MSFSLQRGAFSGDHQLGAGRDGPLLFWGGEGAGEWLGHFRSVTFFPSGCACVLASNSLCKDFFKFLSSINRTCIEESTCSIYFVHGSWLPLHEFFPAFFLLCRNFFGNCPTPSPLLLKKELVLPQGGSIFPS